MSNAILKQAYSDPKDDKDSPDWDRIKEFVGGQRKTKKHPLDQEAERNQARQPQNFDEGGPVLPDPNDPRGTIPPVPGVPPGGAPVPVAPPGAPVPPAGMPPAVPGAPPMDAGTDAQATSAMGGITPEVIKALMDKINDQSRMKQIGAGFAGLGDAIASVGGGKTEHLKNAENMIQQDRENAMKVPAMMTEAGKQKFALSKEIGGDEPTSRRSFVAQQANLPLLSKMGFTPEQIKAMPASLIDGIRGGAITREEALARIQETGAFQKASLDINRATLANTAENEKAQREQEAQRLAQEKEKQAADIQGGAAKTLAGQGMFKSILDSIPGTAGHQAREVLRKQATGNAPPPFTAPQPGQTVTHPNGAKVTRTN